MTPAAKAEVAKALARDLGFDRLGITPAQPVARAEYYRSWLARGYGGSMAFLRRNLAARADPRGLLPGARTVLCAAMNYRREDAPPAPLPGTSPRPLGRVARYARGRDYHTVLHRRLKRLVAELRARLDEPFEARVCVDTQPVLERALAAAAGVGWIGKNTCLMHEEFGSYLFLGEVVTTLDLAADGPVTDHCGTCTRCLEACPTGAFRAPYELDASRCIAYLTIEHHGEIPVEFHAGIGDRVFGCDVCQEVCPFNRDAPRAADPDLLADVTPAYVDLAALVALRSGDHRRLTRGSAARRAPRPMWQRNGEIALANAEVWDRFPTGHESLWRTPRTKR